MNGVPLVRYDTTVSQQSVGLNASILAHSSYSTTDDKITSRKRKKQLTSHRLVEKRRRDRINKSLHELRDLIPKLTRTTQTFKNDKVELLQATIDYLNDNTNTTGATQPQRVPVTQPVEDTSIKMCTQFTDINEPQTDTVSRTDGFRDCMEETIRYLIENEGFPSEHPVILRLRTHLQQRLELCGQGIASTANHTVCSGRTISMIPHGSPAIPTGAVDTSDSAHVDIMKPLTVDTRYQYAIPESISQHLTQESQNNNGALNRCLISNNSLLAVVPETTGYMNNNGQCNIPINQQASLIYPQQQMHGTNCSTVTGFNFNYVAPYVMAWVRPQQPNMTTSKI